MTEQEYTNLINYLFVQLREFNLDEIVEEINGYINRGKTVTLKNAEDLKVKKINQREVGKTQTLPLTPKEAFEIAIDHLFKVIIEIPSYANRIRAVFGNNITWESEQTQSIKSLNTAANSFSLGTFTFEDSELEQAQRQIRILKSLLKDSDA